MKLLIQIFIFFGFIAFSFSQHDQRLLIKYSQNELDAMKSNDYENYKILENALDKGIFIGEIPTEKSKEIVFDGELAINLNETHTFLSLGITLKENEYQYFKIKGTNKLVGVLPKSLLK